MEQLTTKDRRARCSNKVMKILKFKWAMLRRTKPITSQDKAMKKICGWGRSLKGEAKKLYYSKSDPSYISVGHEPTETKHLNTPKGHLPVYVGEKDDDTCRYLVPVIYFNHPLFEKLLREAEKEFGFDHPGGIQIPCRVSEFENIRRRIDASTALVKIV